MSEGKKTSVRYTFYSSLGNGLIILIFISMYSLGLWYGKNLIISNIDTGKYDAAVILTTFLCFIVGGSSVSQLSPFFKSVAEGKVAMSEFLDLIEREKTLIEPADGIVFEKISNITLKHVNFHYKSDQPVLRKVNI